jgi:beta-glucosidase
VLDFHWWENAPADGLKPDTFSVRWDGTLVPPVSGRHALGLRVFGEGRLYVDDSLLVEVSDEHVVLTKWMDVDLVAERSYRVRVEYRDRRADAIVQLVWSPPEHDAIEHAVEIARQADAVIVVGGLSSRLEGEEMPVAVPGFAGGDRTDLSLPATQERLLRRLVATGKPVVLVLLNGSALAATWAAEHVPAIVEAWYPGQAAGTAIADVLFGAYNPAGRLPVTFYRSVEQLPPFDDYAIEGRTYRYFTDEPLFPFGHGLSYTRFSYSDLRMPEQVEAGADVALSVEVRNDGAVAGDEVVQLYVSALDAPNPAPIRSLTGFQRIHLVPGERRRVEFVLTPKQLALVNAEGRHVITPGAFSLSIGGRQPGFTGVADDFTSGVVRGLLAVTGTAVELPR